MKQPRLYRGFPFDAPLLTRHSPLLLPLSCELPPSPPILLIRPNSTEGPNPDMIQLFTLTSTIRCITPLAWMLQGDVRPEGRKFGGYAARGRAP